MKDFPRWSVTLLAVLLSLTGLVVVGARTQPVAIESYAFDVCDGKPCYAGVDPGMTWAQAVAALADHVNKIYEDPGVVVVRQNGFDFRFTASRDYLTIDSITVSPWAARRFLRLGDFVLKYQKPCKVIAAATTSGASMVIFPQMSLVLAQNAAHISPNSRINHILIAKVSGLPDFCDFGQSDGQQPADWHGFRSIAVSVD